MSIGTIKDMNSLPYDKTSATSIFEYSKGLLGGTLRKYTWEGYQPKKGKGSLGQMVENLYFLLETNNNPASDFSEAGLELKCTPLKKSKKDDYLIKERLSCNMITFNNLFSTNGQHTLQEIQPQGTSHNDSSPWNLQTGYSSSCIPANAWSAEFHPDNECIHVRCLGHFSRLRASAPS